MGVQRTTTGRPVLGEAQIQERRAREAVAEIRFAKHPESKGHEPWDRKGKKQFGCGRGENFFAPGRSPLARFKKKGGIAGKSGRDRVIGTVGSRAARKPKAARWYIEEKS